MNGESKQRMIDRLRGVHRYMGIFDFEYFLDITYGALNSLLIESGNLINRKEKEVENLIEKWKTDRLSYNDSPEPFEMYETEAIEVNQFSSLLNNSFLLMAYSIFERNMYQICSYCQKEEDEQKSVTNVKAENYIDKCRKYIEEVIGVNLSNIQNEWSEIENYRKIRNSIAHKNGVLKESDKNLNLINFIVKNKSIELDESTNTVKIESLNFISDFTKLTKGYISKLLDEIYRQKRK